MGCIASKQSVSVRPDSDGGGGGGYRENGSVPFRRTRLTEEESEDNKNGDDSCRFGNLERGNSRMEDLQMSFGLGNFQKHIEGEQVAAGWPSWLSAVAGEAVQGWVPLRAESFEKLEKIGQGTYSSVFRAREIETGRIVALKKVRFDNYEPESVRFMSREIMILRKLDHPNIMKLDGLITSRSSCSVYLVFEYMEHDLTGLSSSPDIKFSESQIKCYMQQLLSGLEHCHSKGVMHRDIKGSNLLVNNEGVLKLADFGLANFVSHDERQLLTSRVVTLWYRPPELLLGSTNYGKSVDLWSVGCVFAELLLGKPILKGRTEVEQLHKIFKLCGSPPDEYWKKSKLPHATVFKPQQFYESCLGGTCKDFPTNALNLVETFLSIEPYKRGTASTALSSKYFSTKPYACLPSSLPKYPPNKEIDAKTRSDLARRKRTNGRARKPEPARRRSRVPTDLPIVSVAPTELEHKINTHRARKTIGNCALFPKVDDIDARTGEELCKPSINMVEEDASLIKKACQEDFSFSGPLQVRTSSGFAWAKGRKEDQTTVVGSRNRYNSGSKVANCLDPSSVLPTRTSDMKGPEIGFVLYGSQFDSRDQEMFGLGHDPMQKHWNNLEHLESFDTTNKYKSQDLSAALQRRREMAAERSNLDEGNRVEFSGPMFSQSFKVDELLEKRERQIRSLGIQKGRRHNQRAAV